jgi:hypothetical protein
LIGCGQSAFAHFAWTPPNPLAYGGDDHFCLLAYIAAPNDPEWVGFSGTDLNINVLNMRTVGWRNIHIIAVNNKKIGNIVATNFKPHIVRPYLDFELRDRRGRRMNLASAGLILTPDRQSLDKLRDGDRARQPGLEATGHGSYRLFGDASGFSTPALEPGESVVIGLDFEAQPPRGGYVLRATLFDVSGVVASPIGGQTFVAGRALRLARTRRVTARCGDGPRQRSS